MRLKQLSRTISNIEGSEMKMLSAFASKTMGVAVLADRFKQKNYARKG